MVDTLGLIWAAVVCSAATQEIPGARPVLERLRGRCPRLVMLWADKAYHSLALIAWVGATLGAALEVVRKPAGQKGFSPLPKRWTVERTFGWLGKYRRLSKDYEYTVASSEAYLYLAMIHLMVRRLRR